MAAATATMAQIRAGLAGALASLTGWSVGEYATSNNTPPYIQIMGAVVDYDQAMGRGADSMSWLVLACVPATTDQGAQILLETLIDPTSATSFKTLIEADKTLGGVVSWARVVTNTRPAIYTMSGQPESLGVEFTVEVMT